MHVEILENGFGGFFGADLGFLIKNEKYRKPCFYFVITEKTHL